MSADSPPTWSPGTVMTNELPYRGIYASVSSVIIGSVNGLSPGRRQAIIWINVGLLSIGTVRTNFSEIVIEIRRFHYNDVIMSAIASQIISLTIVYSTVYSGANQRKHLSSASLAFLRGIHRCPVNSPHKGPVTWKMLPFDDVSMSFQENAFENDEC